MNNNYLESIITGMSVKMTSRDWPKLKELLLEKDGALIEYWFGVRERFLKVIFVEYHTIWM